MYCEITLNRNVKAELIPFTAYVDGCCTCRWTVGEVLIDGKKAKEEEISESEMNLLMADYATRTTAKNRRR